MVKFVAALVVGLLVGLGLGYAAFDSDPVSQTATAAADNSHGSPDAMPEAASQKEETQGEHGEQNHAMIEVDKSKPVPGVRVEVVKDSMSGVNVRLITENFTFTPENEGKQPVANTGHAHVFVNGKKVGRTYSEWFHVAGDELKEADNVILATLNADNHAEWITNGKHIQGTANYTK